MPLAQNVAGGEAEKDRWSIVKSKAQSNQLDDIEPEIFIKHYSALKKIASDARNRILPENLHWEDGNTPNEWIYGPTGTGMFTFENH